MTTQLAICIVSLSGISFAALQENSANPAPAKPEPKAQESKKKSPSKKATPTPKPQPSRKDLALKEARRCDADKNGRLDGLEVMTLNNILKSNPESFLYLLDENGSHSFDTAEVAAINQAIKKKK